MVTWVYQSWRGLANVYGWKLAQVSSITIGSADLLYDEVLYKFFTISGTQYCTTFESSHWFVFNCSVWFFFVLRVTYLHHGFFNGLFVITLLSSGWIVRNWSRVLLRNSSRAGHMPRSRGCFLNYGNKKIAFRWDCIVWQKVSVRLDCSGEKVPVGRFGLNVVRRLVCKSCVPWYSRISR